MSCTSCLTSSAKDSRYGMAISNEEASLRLDGLTRGAHTAYLYSVHSIDSPLRV